MARRHKVAQLMHRMTLLNTSSDASQVSNAVIGTSQVKYDVELGAGMPGPRVGRQASAGAEGRTLCGPYRAVLIRYVPPHRLAPCGHTRGRRQACSRRRRNHCRRCPRPGGQCPGSRSRPAGSAQRRPSFAPLAAQGGQTALADSLLQALRQRKVSSSAVAMLSLVSAVKSSSARAGQALGQVSAYWMEMRMSGTPSCAMIE